MNLIFFDKNRKSVIEWYNFQSETEGVVSFQVKISLSIFEIDFHADSSERDLFKLMEDIRGVDSFKVETLEFISTDLQLKIQLKRDEYGHIQYLLKVTEKQNNSVFEGCFFSDITFMGELANGIERILHVVYNKVQCEMSEVIPPIPYLSLRDIKDLDDGFCELNLFFQYLFARVEKNVMASLQEITQLKDGLQSLSSKGTSFYFSPLGSMLIIEGIRQDKKILLSGVINDFSFPSNNLEFHEVQINIDDVDIIFPRKKLS